MMLSKKYNYQIAPGTCRIQDKKINILVEYQNWNERTQSDINP